MTRKKLRPHIYTPDVWRHLSWNLPRFACLKDQQITLSHACSLGIICSQHHHHHHHQQQQQEQEQQQPSCLFFPNWSLGILSTERVPYNDTNLRKSHVEKSHVHMRPFGLGNRPPWQPGAKEGDQLKLGFVDGCFMMFPKIVGFPSKSSNLIGFSIINHPLWGTPIFGNTHVFFGILRVPLSNNPFPRWILGIQTTHKKHELKV